MKIRKLAALLNSAAEFASEERRQALANLSETLSTYADEEASQFLIRMRFLRDVANGHQSRPSSDKS